MGKVFKIEPEATLLGDGKYRELRVKLSEDTPQEKSQGTTLLDPARINDWHVTNDISIHRIRIPLSDILALSRWAKT